VRGVVIFGVGSPLVVDLEEGLRRAGTQIVAAVANVPGNVHVLGRGPVIDRAELTPEIAAEPYLVPLFTPANRHRAVEDAISLGFRTPASFTDSTVAQPESLSAEPGLWVNTGATLGAASTIGRFALINRGASVGHHADLGDFASIGPNATLAGEVSLGTGAAIGAGAVVLPGITVGDHAVVGAGSVVTRDVPSHTMVVGNPARPVREGLEGFQ
jgi:sugar O-acyltransferase (sialic acid O-acetyltransferase NeuD family)